MLPPRELLSSLWIFAMLNYLYADLMGLMDASILRGFLAGNVGGLAITQGFLLGAAVLMEIPIAMTLLSRLLPRRSNRVANLVSGSLKTVVVLATLFVGTPTVYYTFFVLLEAACTAWIVVIAWRWREEAT
jgi:hypothetical protein